MKDTNKMATNFELVLPDLLRQVIFACETFCVAGCCGTGGPDFQAEPFSSHNRTMGAPPLRFLQGWVAAPLISCKGMTVGLHRYYGAHHLHFITWSCYRRKPLLRSAKSRDCLLDILEQVRQKYRFVVAGYVIMPEHVHVLMSEPESGDPSDVMRELKQRSARALLPRRKRQDPRQRMLFEDAIRIPFWQARFYDFNVWTARKRVEKLHYMHKNPVKRGLVTEPEDWCWSSCRFYSLGEVGKLAVNEGWAKISFREWVA